MLCVPCRGRCNCFFCPNPFFFCSFSLSSLGGRGRLLGRAGTTPRTAPLQRSFSLFRVNFVAPPVFLSTPLSPLSTLESVWNIYSVLRWGWSSEGWAFCKGGLVLRMEHENKRAFTIAPRPRVGGGSWWWMKDRNGDRMRPCRGCIAHWLINGAN